MELLTHADALADRVDRSVIRWWQGLWHRRPPPDYFRLLPVIVRAEVRDGLTRLAYWAHGRTARVLADTVPLAWLQGALLTKADGALKYRRGFGAVAARQAHNLEVTGAIPVARTSPASPVTEDVASPDGPGALELLLQTLGLTWRDLLGPLREPDTLSTDQARDLFQQLLFPPPPEAKVRAWVDRLLVTTNFQGDDGRTSPDRLAAVFSRAYSQGKAPGEIARELEPLVDNVKASARRIARTWGMAAAHAVQQESHDQLDDLTIGYQTHATLDQNTRPAHRLRNGTIYYRNPKPGQPGLDEMPHPPMESARDGHAVAFNCRCWNSPVLGPPTYLKPEDLTLFRDNAGAAVPNPAVYETWFQQAGERQRRLAVGSRRYSELRDQLGREPDYAHFVDADGSILPLATLRSEDPKDREARVNKVRRMMADRARDIARVATYGFMA